MAVAEKTTFVKFDRNLLKWRWFQHPKTLAVWIWLIMNANVEDHDFERETIHRGEVATSYRRIMTDTGLSSKEVRTALNHLKETGEVATRIRPKYQVISILEYSRYQDVPAGKTAGKGQAKGRQTAGKGQQYKNVRSKEEKNEKNDCVHTPPSRAEVEEFCKGLGITTDIDAFLQYNSATGWKIGRTKVEDWRPLLMKWVSHDDGSAINSNNDDGLDDFGRPIRKEI
jgi:hypothetical protein